MRSCGWGAIVCLGVLGCSRSGGEARREASDEAAKGAAPAKKWTVKVPEGAASAAPSASALPDDKQIAATLTKCFGQYKDGSDFAFFSQCFASKVEPFITVKSTTPEAMRKDAVQFYKDKTELKYEPIVRTLWVTPDADGARETAEVLVRMQWKTSPPKGWGDGYPPGKVARSVEVVVDLGVGADGTWSSYVEKEVKRPSYEVVDPDGALGAFDKPPTLEDDDAKAPVKLAKGTIVQDLGETFVSETTPRGDVVARKIRHAGKDLWAIERAATTVENPSGGTSAGVVVSLEKVE